MNLVVLYVTRILNQVTDHAKGQLFLSGIMPTGDLIAVNTSVIYLNALTWTVQLPYLEVMT